MNEIKCDLFKPYEVNVNLNSETCAYIDNIFEKYNIECCVENLKLLINGLISFDATAKMEIQETLKLSNTNYITFWYEYNRNFNIKSRYKFYMQ